MTTLVLGDLHVWNHKQFGGPVVGGLNRRCRDILQSVYQIVEYAKLHHKVTHVVQLGDFFDGPKPSPQILNAALDMIAATNVEWHIIAGNHDISSYDAPSALSPMNHAGKVCVYDKAQFATINGNRWLMVPYSGPNALEALKVLETVPEYSKTYLAVHYGLVNEKPRTDCITPEQLNVLTCNGRKAVTGYFGHEHDSKAVLRGVGVSCGSLLPLNFSDIDKPLRVFTDQEKVRIPESLVPKFVDLRGLPNSILENPSAFLLWLVDLQYISDFALYCRINPRQEQHAKELLSSGLITGYQIFQEYASPTDTSSGAEEANDDPESYIWSAAAQVETDKTSALAETLNTAIQESQ